MTGGLDPEIGAAEPEAPEPRAPRERKEPAVPPIDAQVLALLDAERRPWTPEEIASRTSIPVRTVQRTLGKLVRDRYATKAGGGKFALARHRPR